MSLTAHLTADRAGHGRLAFHPDCPRCRDERLAGSLEAHPLNWRRAQGAFAAGLLVFSAAAPPAAAQTPGPAPAPQQPPNSAPPGLGTDVDPGDGSVPDTYTAPTEGGGDDDQSEGPPVDTTPPDEPLATTPPAETPAPEPAPPPAPAPPPPAPPPPVAPTAPTPQQPPPPAPTTEPAPPPAPPQPPAAAPKTGALIEAPEPRAAGGPVRHIEIGVAPKPHTAPADRPTTTAPPASVDTGEPAAADSDTATTPATQPTGASVVPASQPSSPPARGIEGNVYTVREGDTLWSIARQRLGPDASAGQIAREVNRLWELNQHRIATGSADLIHVGTVLEL